MSNIPSKSVDTIRSKYHIPSMYAYAVLKRHLKRTNPVLWKNLPKENSGFASALCLLWDNPGGASREDLQIYAIHKGAKLKVGGDNLQMRHLSTQKGFNITRNGDILKLVDLDNCSPSYVHTSRNTDRMTAQTWQTILTNYNNLCANCGSENGSPQRWDPRVVTKLQRGHMDPREALSLHNCIPQCGYCNRQYKDKAVFNIRGVVVDFDKTGFKRK